MSKPSTYKLHDLVIALCPNYPPWPGKIIKCYPQSYVVFFYGQKTEAHIHESYIQPFTRAAVNHMLNFKPNPKKIPLKRAIGLARQVQAARQSSGRVQEFEEEQFDILIKPRRQTKTPSNKMQEKPVIKRRKDKNDSYEIFKDLLDDFAMHCSHLHGKKQPQSPPASNQQRQEKSKSPPASNEQRQEKKKSPPPVFNQRDEKKLVEMLTSKLDLEEIVKHRVLETMIVVIKEINQWYVPKYDDLKNMIVSKFEEWKGKVLSGEEELGVNSLRRARLEYKLKKNMAVLGDYRSK